MKGPGIVLLIAFVCIAASGCTATAQDPVVGTWEWSDGHGYTELYRFSHDHSFRAEALGSDFSGTWKQMEPGLYLITYQNVNATTPDATVRAETVVYDEKTDAVYFPAHRRVSEGGGVYLITTRESGR